MGDVTLAMRNAAGEVIRSVVAVTVASTGIARECSNGQWLGGISHLHASRSYFPVIIAAAVTVTESSRRSVVTRMGEVVDRLTV